MTFDKADVYASAANSAGSDAMPQIEIFRIEIPASHKNLNVVSACLNAIVARLEASTDITTLSYHIQLVVQELCTNIIEHAYINQPNGIIWISIKLNSMSNKLEIELHDQGQSFDPASVDAPNLNEAQVGGYGLFLIDQLMDEVTYDPQPNFNRWYLVKNL